MPKKIKKNNETKLCVIYKLKWYNKYLDDNGQMANEMKSMEFFVVLNECIFFFFIKCLDFL